MSSVSPTPAPEAPTRSMLRQIFAALRGETFDYTTGSLGRAVVLLAIPMVLEMVMESLFAVVDIRFVSELGESAVAAVGLTESVLVTFYAIGIGMSFATTATVARRIGEKDDAGASLAATQAVFATVALGLLFAAPCFVFAEEILSFMADGDAGIVAEGSGYTRIMLGLNVLIMLLFVQNAVFRSAGDPSLAMKSLWLANGINILLDPCLIFGLGPFPALGVEGAAWATVIGRGTGVLYQFAHLRSGHGHISLRGDRFRLDLPILRRLLRLSVGSTLQFLLATGSWTMIVRIIAPFGPQALAGYTVGIRVILFTILPAWGLSNAAATLVGQCLGAEDPKRAERAVWLCGLCNMVFMGTVMAAFYLGSDWIVAFFELQPEAHRVAEQCLHIIVAGYLFFAWGMVMVQAFNGAGDTMTPTWINLGVYWALQIPAAWLLAHPLGLGPAGVFWAIALSESLYAVVCIAVFRRGRWKTREV